MPSTIEKYLYMEKLERQDMTVRDATILAQENLGYRLNLNDDEMLDWID